MTLFRGIDDDNDWLFGAGKQSYFRNDLAVETDIKTALQTFYQESFYEPDEGVAWFSLLGQRSVDLLNLNIRAAIIKVEGVTSVQNVSVSLDQNRNCVVKYLVTTIYTTQLAGEVILK
jgi:hypothetical protein